MKLAFLSIQNCTIKKDKALTSSEIVMLPKKQTLRSTDAKKQYEFDLLLATVQLLSYSTGLLSP